jgi:hypothetical protein
MRRASDDLGHEEESVCDLSCLYADDLLVMGKRSEDEAER